MDPITGQRHIYQKRAHWAIGLLVILFPFLFGSCAPTKTTRPILPAFNYATLTSTLQRSVSSTADVKAALGEPTGSGQFLFDKEFRTIWFYEKMKVDTSGQKLDLQQDVLLVFFKEERFDGFLWFSDAQKW